MNSRAATERNQAGEHLLLGLRRWHEAQLEIIEEKMIELAEDYRAASDGLAIIHRNPGITDDDIPKILWTNLERSAVEWTRLEREHDEILGLPLPELLVKFQRRAAA